VGQSGEALRGAWKGETRVSEAQTKAASGVGEDLEIRRFFTTEGVHPYDEIEWDTRDAVIQNFKTGEVAFEQKDVEVPKAWSQNATNIAAQKYFRGTLGTSQRERSVKQMIGRVVNRYHEEGLARGYFADEREASTFKDELTHLLVTQKAAFNSPVWFNVGWRPKGQEQCSACYILSVEDEMHSILNWYVEEGLIFKHGSGSGINLSTLRSSKERLRSGGTASGPVSFMRGAEKYGGRSKPGGGE
jgi:ribonucleoside-diphosphate reductase alpha chain